MVDANSTLAVDAEADLAIAEGVIWRGNSASLVIELPINLSTEVAA